VKSAGQILFEWANANIKVIPNRAYASMSLRTAVYYYRLRLKDSMAEHGGHSGQCFPTGSGGDIIVQWPDDHNRIAEL